jgi:hypothetical protein
MSRIQDANRERVLQCGVGYADRMKNNLIAAIKNNFMKSPSYFEVKINNGIDLVGVHIIDDATTTNQTNHNSKNIVMQPNDNLKVGDLIDYQNNKWLCVACEMFNDIYYKGKILKAEHTLTVNKNSDLYEVPACVESSVQLYRMNQSENKYFSELSDNIVLRVPNNDITNVLDIDNVYQLGRFKYKIVNLSDIIEPGILVIKMEITNEPIETNETSFNINP